jgi:hypothetical protein
VSIARRLARLEQRATARALPVPTDPVALARAAGLELDDWQREVVTSTADRLLLNCCRQAGKSTATGVLSVHTALSQSSALVLLLSPTLRQSQELFRKCAEVYRAAGRPVDPTAESALRLELENGSRIVSLPGSEKTTRGYSGPALVVIDEAARIPAELYAAIRPVLAVSRGRLALLSTPYGTRGVFYDAWRERARWHYVEVPADRCPRISPEFLEEARREMGEWWYSQEFLCQFLDAQTAAFRREDIDRAFAEEVEVWDLTS